MAVRLERGRVQHIAFGERRQHLLLGVAGRLVETFLVGEQEAPEGDHGAGGRELGAAAVGGGGGDPHRDGLPARVLHLRCDGALPDQVVDVELLGRQLAAHLVGRAEPVAGRANRLVRLLGVLHLAVVLPRLRRHRVGAVQLARLSARRA